MFVHVLLSSEVWIENAVAYAASQFSVTPQIDCVLPRSTSSHCGSAKALDHRVAVLPSAAFCAGKLAFSVDDAAAVLFSAMFVAPQVPPPLEVTAQLKDVEAVAPVPSFAVTVTLDVPVAVGVPEIKPVEELIDRPAGRPLALYGSVWLDAESVAWICRLAAAPTVVLWLPGLVTVTVFPVPPLGSVHCCCAESVQVSMSSRAPVLPPGSVRQSPEFGLTSSPLAWWFQP